MFPFKLALNSSTLFPFGLGVKDQIRIAAEAGYEGIELWVKDIEAFIQAGGTLQELRRYIQDTGIAVVNAIAFFPWADADESVRKQGMLQAEREISMLAEIGCVAVAAPPSGNVEGVSLSSIAGHFAELAEVSRSAGVEPYLEFWGRAKRLSKLSEVMYVALESGVKEAKILLDPFHMYTGGSAFEGIGLINGSSIGIVHSNDYPSSPPRETIADSDRVFPGDGVAPSREIAVRLHESGYRGFLSLELFIPDFGSKTALEVASAGLETMKKAYDIRA
ncbi:sugar phosphate isomerase/epimerase family protein [Paenibacillus thermotolerans]|uniref:sugar phosphate isomerase/epimerase family protein n=1 Tax=Paenibacillus thermotolerans TaxID=3027807 RepID=UPI002368BA92|nr:MULTISPECIES: sugar phosphate isomerase/epimerase family protein [unclassified Paenibacillus]